MQAEESALQNRNPAIERMAAIFHELEKCPTGLGLKGLSERTGVTRSTVYRILNSLAAHGLVRQLANSDYVLGGRLVDLANAVVVPDGGNVARVAQPHIDTMSRMLGESAKVSVYDHGRALVVAVAAGTKSYALQARVGEHLPIHAGAGSKALMAHLGEDERRRIYKRPLVQFNDRTFIDPPRLEVELALVREQGWSRDHGEFSSSVNAYAAPIRDSSGKVVAAVSVPFLAGREPEYQDIVRNTVVEMALRIGHDLG